MVAARKEALQPLPAVGCAACYSTGNAYFLVFFAGNLGRNSRFLRPFMFSEKSRSPQAQYCAIPPSSALCPSVAFRQAQTLLVVTRPFQARPSPNPPDSRGKLNG